MDGGRGCGWGTQEVGPCEKRVGSAVGSPGAFEQGRSTQVILLFLVFIFLFGCTLSYCGTWDLRSSAWRADS